MPIPLTVHRRKSGRGIILYPPPTRLVPTGGMSMPVVLLYFSLKPAENLSRYTRDLKQTCAKEQQSLRKNVRDV
jgi:hypothetical protein